MLTFEDINKGYDSIIDEEPFYSKAAFKTTGLPKGFSELPQGYFIYIIVALGRVQFISASVNPWEVAEKFRKRFRGDRVLYKQTSFNTAEAEIAKLIEQYQPPYNYKAESIQLSELNALLSKADANAA